MTSNEEVFVLLVKDGDDTLTAVHRTIESAQAMALDWAQGHWKQEFDGEEAPPAYPHTYEDISEYEIESADEYKPWEHQIRKEPVVE